MTRPSLARARGFTLIELMVVVALIGVLLAFAIPAYRDSVRNSRRAVAQTCLTEGAQFMERFYTTNLQYHQTRPTAAVPVPVAVAAPGACTQDISAFYTVGFDEDNPPTATTYNLVAIPQDDQAEDACGTLTLDNTGARGQSSGTLADCWR